MPLKILILDDQPSRHAYFRKSLLGEVIFQAWSADEANKMLATESNFDVVFLDHDLEEDHYINRDESYRFDRTGSETASFITRMSPDRKPAKIVVHSMNAKGAEKITNILKEGGIEVIRWKFNRQEPPPR